MDITEDLTSEDSFLAIPEVLFITPDVQFKYEIGPGDDVLMIGMFSDHFGQQRNIPAVRFGNISVEAAADNPLPQENRTKQPSHLADMRSRSGFSGSPVFVFRNHLLNLTGSFHWRRNLSAEENFGFKTGAGFSQPEDTFVGFLGVHCAQFLDQVSFISAPPTSVKSEKLGDPIREGDKLLIQSGMTIIAPAWRVTETIDLNEFAEVRRAREAKRTMDSPS